MQPRARTGAAARRGPWRDSRFAPAAARARRAGARAALWRCLPATRSLSFRARVGVPAATAAPCGRSGPDPAPGPGAAAAAAGLCQQAHLPPAGSLGGHREDPPVGRAARPECRHPHPGRGGCQPPGPGLRHAAARGAGSAIPTPPSADWLSPLAHGAGNEGQPEFFARGRPAAPNSRRLLSLAQVQPPPRRSACRPCR
ncbi:hypothetical protein RA210_U80153 [Rubrivivax sp. A210]|nr:hypothetical protein RA210_U80153 [Rubrivivax sp. A210]